MIIWINQAIIFHILLTTRRIKNKSSENSKVFKKSWKKMNLEAMLALKKGQVYFSFPSSLWVLCCLKKSHPLLQENVRCKMLSKSCLRSVTKKNDAAPRKTRYWPQFWRNKNRNSTCQITRKKVSFRILTLIFLGVFKVKIW